MTDHTAVLRPADPVAVQPRSGKRRRTVVDPPVGWPLFALFGGYPLWWVLGFGGFCSLIFAIPMAVYLVQQRRVLVPRGFGMWLLFLVWVLGGVLVLQVHAPGTVATHSMSRYFTFGLRFVWYLAATVVLLYVINTRKALSSHRIALALSYMFVVVTFGGILGLLAPHFEFRSGLEYALPGRLAHNGFVQSMVHPVTAQVQDFLGYEEARPSAPFPYTNGWGLAIACFLPFFVVTWCAKGAGWRRAAAVPILILAGIATIFSLNRGLWIALIAASVFVAIRYALMGRVRMLFALGAAALVTVSMLVFSPLGSLILERIAHPDSNEGRANLGSLTVASVLEGSPLIGFGATRNVLGNFQSIAAAASASCPGCSPPPLGTQGHLWLVLFSQGVVGLVLYTGFIVFQLVRHLRLSSPIAIAACAVLLVHLVTMPVYDSIGPSLFAIFAAIGLLWRCESEQSESLAALGRARRSAHETSPPSVDTYVRFARRHARGILVAAIVGGIAGALFQLGRTTPVTATQSVLIPSAARAAGLGDEITIDTDAQLVASDQVLSVVAAVAGEGETHAELADRLRITASPNTRILHIAFTAGTARAALNGVEAATQTYLHQRSELTGKPRAHADPGEIVQAATVKLSRDPWKISITTGAMISIVVMVLYWRLVGDGRARLRRPRSVTLATGMPVLASVTTIDGWVAEDDGVRVQRGLAQQSITSVLATRDSEPARRFAAQIDEVLEPKWASRSSGTAIVASTRSRTDELTRAQAAAQLSGQRVVGVVLVEES